MSCAPAAYLCDIGALAAAEQADRHHLDVFEFDLTHAQTAHTRRELWLNENEGSVFFCMRLTTDWPTYLK